MTTTMTIQPYLGTAECSVLPGASAKYVAFLTSGTYSQRRETTVHLCLTHAQVWAKNNEIELPPYEPEEVPVGPDMVVPYPEDGLDLNLEDPFEKAIAAMVAINRAKRADYANDMDPFSNFRRTAAMMGIETFGTLESVRFNLAQKMARLQALAENGRSPRNESVRDTWLDLAVYAVIGYCVINEEEA
jgi:hypothetical protein